MANTFESKEECGAVEAFIWDRLAISCGEFEGVKELSINDLIILKGLIEVEIFNHIKAR